MVTHLYLYMYLCWEVIEIKSLFCFVFHFITTFRSHESDFQKSDVHPAVISGFACFCNLFLSLAVFAAFFLNRLLLPVSSQIAADVLLYFT